VFGIVRQSGGSIRVETAPGRGATFRLYFPSTPEPATAPEASAAGARNGSATVLLVEDDDSLRGLLLAQLEHFGYRGIACRNGHEALERAAGERVDLLLTDVVMPDMGGRALAESFARSNPGTPVLFMSGYTADEGVAEDASVAFLQKPFTFRQLAERIRELLPRM
jgi:CheY-like chemotaxis protein